MGDRLPTFYALLFENWPSGRIGLHTHEAESSLLIDLQKESRSATCHRSGKASHQIGRAVWQIGDRKLHQNPRQSVTNLSLLIFNVQFIGRHKEWSHTVRVSRDKLWHPWKRKRP